ncbi:MAG TPA: SMI1/KNR4 family protein [Thermoanaerobaculia bacterium]|nr:SMI1/KNR4 family protein [Thermoanaerobaculia bacterium]
MRPNDLEAPARHDEVPALVDAVLAKDAELPALVNAVPTKDEELPALHPVVLALVDAVPVNERGYAALLDEDARNESGDRGIVVGLHGMESGDRVKESRDHGIVVSNRRIESGDGGIVRGHRVDESGELRIVARSRGIGSGDRLESIEMPTPKQVLEAALRERFVGGDGEELHLELEPGLSDEEIEEIAGRLPAPLPAEIRELLRRTSGFDFPFSEILETLSFVGESFGLEEIFPTGVQIARDNFGNAWIVDVHPDTGLWAPVFYTCHDPAVAVLQSPDLATFLDEVLNLGRPGRRSALVQIHEETADTIWTDNPGLIPMAEARESRDPALRAFAAYLPDGASLVDLRAGTVGSGFSLGLHGPRTILRRYESERLFALIAPEKKAGFFPRLFGRG